MNRSTISRLSQGSIQSVYSGLFSRTTCHRDYLADNVLTACSGPKQLCLDYKVDGCGSHVGFFGGMQTFRAGRLLQVGMEVDVHHRPRYLLPSFMALRCFATGNYSNGKKVTKDNKLACSNEKQGGKIEEKVISQTEGNITWKMTMEELYRCCTPNLIHSFSQRSHTCGELNEELAGESVSLCGWVSAVEAGRFVLLQDGYGSARLVADIQNTVLTSAIENLNLDSIVSAEGVVRRATAGQESLIPGTSYVDILLKSLTVVNVVDSVPARSQANGSWNNDGNWNDKWTSLPSEITDVESENEVLPNLNKYSLRTHTCGELNVSHVGQKVRLAGWLEFCRMQKFIVLRDGYGKCQLVVPESRSDLRNVLETLSLESVLMAEGTVRSRPPGQQNEKEKSGAIEVTVTDLKVLNESKVLPFYMREFNKPHEPLRLKYRYLDLRSQDMQRNLRLRSQVIHKMRRFLIEHLGFVEVETPTLFKRTPGGAQEFVVPTTTADKYYSLVQSPQQFKQLLMIGGLDRYFQVARCYRDEGYRNDRQPEFTQLDIELSFCNRENILELIEDLLKYCWPTSAGSLSTPFPKMTYDEAMNCYGTDKPDLRFDCKLENLTALFKEREENCHTGKYSLNKYLSEDDFGVYAFVWRKKENIQATCLKSIEKIMKDEMNINYPRTGFLFLPVKSEEKMKEKLQLLFSPRIAAGIQNATRYRDGHVIFMAFGSRKDVLSSLGKLRVNLANYLHENNITLLPKNDFKFVWIVDFPLFEGDGEKLESAHHPFTQPLPEDCHLLESEPLKVKSLHFDLVLNGNEVGGGSIRVKDSNLQKMILEKILNQEPECISHLLEALASGAPPHGGVALGLDRLIACICNASSIRDVIAFPKGRLGHDPMTGAPSDISHDEKIRYHLIPSKLPPTV